MDMILGKYRLIKELSRKRIGREIGSTSFLASSENRKIVLKQYSYNTKLPESAEFSGSLLELSRFMEKEFLKNKAHIERILSVETKDNCLYISRKYNKGKSLAEVAPIPDHWALTLFVNLNNILISLFNMGADTKNVTPENLFFISDKSDEDVYLPDLLCTDIISYYLANDMHDSISTESKEVSESVEELLDNAKTEAMKPILVKCFGSIVYFALTGKRYTHDTADNDIKQIEVKSFRNLVMGCIGSKAHFKDIAEVAEFVRSETSADVKKAAHKLVYEKYDVQEEDFSEDSHIESSFGESSGGKTKKIPVPFIIAGIIAMTISFINNREAFIFPSALLVLVFSVIPLVLFIDFFLGHDERTFKRIAFNLIFVKKLGLIIPVLGILYFIVSTIMQGKGPIAGLLH